ncbi:ANIS5 family metal-binding protein [Prauserella endophytica]|uniref:Uncharacterized protein n=1 Tax=Prauserella endophytica TaxID=1592324 RepID=A0ABY2RUZ5_9PSEU|nr:hypothetical protein [Prauserella endophytica]TKG61540.1 hypothetical protein FCN18_33415 [Prauserella endophytica]
MAHDKKSAARAARELLLQERLPVIESLAEAARKLETLQEREAQARTARRKGEDEVREQYEAAVRTGWDPAELRRLGFTAPRKRRPSGSSGSRPSRSSTPPPSGNGSAVSAGVSASSGAGEAPSAPGGEVKG